MCSKCSAVCSSGHSHKMSPIYTITGVYRHPTYAA